MSIGVSLHELWESPLWSQQCPPCPWQYQIATVYIYLLQEIWSVWKLIRVHGALAWRTKSSHVWGYTSRNDASVAFTGRASRREDFTTIVFYNPWRTAIEDGTISRPVDFYPNASPGVRRLAPEESCGAWCANGFWSMSGKIHAFYRKFYVGVHGISHWYLWMQPSRVSVRV